MRRTFALLAVSATLAAQVEPDRIPPTCLDVRIVTNRPPGLESGAMVHDEARQVLVLFGGSDGLRYCREISQWNGRAWRLVSLRRPSAVACVAVAHDPIDVLACPCGG